MVSFTRTIPREKSQEFVQSILFRPDHYLPLTFRPTRAQPGDYLYLIYRGKLIARVQIAGTKNVQAFKATRTDLPPDWAKWLIMYRGSWEIPPDEILVEGHQGIRYLDRSYLSNLDKQSWNPIK